MSRRFITPAFVDHIIADGRLTQARQRLERGQGVHPSTTSHAHWPHWELICEEVLDTDFDPSVYDAIYAELLRRGFCHNEIDAMRRLAWETAGWLNYDMMSWDWVRLNDGDMKKALEMQLDRGICGDEEYRQRIAEIERIAARPMPELGTNQGKG